MKRAAIVFFKCFLALFLALAPLLLRGLSGPATGATVAIFPRFTDTVVKARDHYVEMRGNVRKPKMNEKEGKMIDSALITIYSGAIPYSELWTNKKGKCTFKLPLDKAFTIQVSKEGYVTKFFEVNTKVPPDKKAAFVFSFDIDIFEQVKNLDVSALQKPIAKVAYNLIMEEFAYDVNYTSRINFELKKLYKNYYLLQKMDADTSLIAKPEKK